MVGVPLPGRHVAVQVWEAQVGRTLLLLDANLPQNALADGDITRELYAEGREERLLQEMVLGIGSWRPLEAPGCWRAEAAVPGGRATGEDTLRVIPHHPAVPWPAVLP